MSQLWFSTFERWSSRNDKKLDKFKKVVLQLTGKRTINDVHVRMSQIPRESMTSLYQLGTMEDIHNCINASEDNDLIPNNAGIRIVEDELTHKKEISINLDSIISDLKCEEVIETKDFKIKIIHERDLKTHGDSKLIKLKIILPKGSAQKENSLIYRTEGFKPEDFSIVSDKFVTFANSLIDVGPTSFNGDSLTCSSPLPAITDAQSDGQVISETLNNTVDIQHDKETKLVEFINNTSTESLELSSTEPEKIFKSLEDLFYLESSQIEQHIEVHKLAIDQDTTISLPSNIETDDNGKQDKHVSPVEKNNYYNDLRNRHFYNGNLKNIEYNTKFSFNPQNVTRHSLDNGDYKYLKLPESNTEKFQKDNSETEQPLSKVTTNRKQGMNYSINCPPIMGKNALLAKSNAMKRNTNKRDSEIIEEIVRDRFKEFLDNYRMRNLRRSFIKRNSNVELIDDEKSTDNTYNSLNLTEEVPIIHITSDGVKSNNSEVEENNEINDVPQEDQMGRLETYKRSVSIASDAGFVSGSSTGKVNRIPEVILSPSSSVTSFESGNFGEFIRSGLFDDVEDNRLSNGIYYSSEQFLMEALADYMNSPETIINEIEDLPTITPDFNKRTMSEDHSIGTSEVSALVSDPTSMYSTLSELRARNNSLTTIASSILEEIMDGATPDYVMPDRNNDELLAKLTKDAAIQYEIIQQTTKALNWCRSRKEFESSREQIEAEKILLTATCQREILLEEIIRIESEDYSEYNGHLGSVQLSNFKFPAKSVSDSLIDLPKKAKDYNQWFVCIAHCGATFYATDAVLADFDGNVEFKNKFLFENLTPEFAITVSIYSMKVKANIRNYSHESKYHLNRSTKKCPSPSKFLTFKRRNSTTLSQTSSNPSGFTLWGTRSLRVGDLAKSSKFQMTNVAFCSTLNDKFSCTFNSSLKVEERFSGFLNIGTQSSGDSISWNKRWCSLHNTELRCWNYPCEEGNSPPLEVLDLRSCLNSWIATVDRSICARSKTLLLETTDGNKITKYFLNADTVNDMKKWEKILNSVVSSLRMWYCMKCYLATKAVNDC